MFLSASFVIGAVCCIDDTLLKPLLQVKWSSLFLGYKHVSPVHSAERDTCFTEELKCQVDPRNEGKQGTKTCSRTLWRQQQQGLRQMEILGFEKE